MNILMINAYYLPETIAFTHLEQDLIRGLEERGHSVTIICPTPSRGVSKEVTKEYKSRKSETVNGVKVLRYWSPRERTFPVLRALRYFWGNFRGNMLGRRCRDTDVVFAVSTPPTQGIFAGKLAKKLHVPFIYSIQDLFPESLISSGLFSKKGFWYKVGEGIARKSYERCDKIILLSDTFRESAKSLGAKESDMVTIGNWIDSEEVKPVPRAENSLFDELGISCKKFVVVYAGNLGASQGADIVVRAARRLRHNTDIHFVVIGSGSEYPRIKHYIKDNHLGNVTLRPIMPPDRVSEIYSMGNVAVITCKRGVSETAVPSKLWSIMACGTPIIASFDKESELADVLKTTGAGCCVEPENPRALVKAIEKQYRESPHQNHAREYVIEHADKKTCVEKYIDAFESVCKTNV